jgi:hypothetical protein
MGGKDLGEKERESRNLKREESRSGKKARDG